MIDEFFALLTPILEKIKSEKKKCYLMGDFNLDLMNSDAHAQTAQFLDLIYSFSFYPLVDKPTRITPHSSTLIDNIFVNSFQEHISGLLYTDVSDHLPIFAVDTSSRGQATETRVTRYRRVNERLIEQFKRSVAQYDWYNLYQIENAEDAYNHFASVLRTLYDQHFPMVDCRDKSKPDKPWISSAIKQSIRVKNKLYKLSHRFPTVYNVLKHKAYKSCLNATIVLRKKMYYRCALNDHKGNLKETWKILKEVIGVSSKKTISQNFHVDHRGDVSDPDEIAGEFNDYFVKVGSKLADTIPVCNLNPLHYVRRNCNSIFFTPVVEQEIIDCLTKLKEGSSGHDGLKPSIIKKCKEHLATPLAYIYNLSITEGCVPTALKHAYITPVFKSGDETLLNNYRPISVLPVFSKVLERLIFNRTYSFITENNILSDQQFGFRKKLSTEMALLSAVDKITQAIDNKEHTIGLFLDLKKAFDTVNLSILLNKLERVGIRGNPLLWFRSYLTQRTQSVKYGNTISTPRVVTTGVPQGSTLGPLLFILYINDMTNVLKNAYPIMFADDTTLFVSSKSVENALSCLNDDIANLTEWFKANKLSLNLTKTHFILFTASSLVRRSDVSLVIDNHNIERVCNTKFLGVYIDERLSWNVHINHVSLKLRKSLGIVRKASVILDTQTMTNLYYTMLFPYLSYCHLIWGNASAYLIDQVLKLQKRAIRIISNVHWLSHTQPLFTERKIMKVNDLFTYFLSLFTFKATKNMFPLSFANAVRINVNSVSLDPNSRRTTAQLPLCRTNIRKNTIIFQCPKLCNDLLYPMNIPPEISYFSFKKLMKNVLL